MPKRLIQEDVTIAASTSSITVDLTDYTDVYRFTGTATLLGALTVSTSGTAAKGDYFEIIYEANLDFDGNTVTILGTVLPEVLESVIGKISCYYNGSSWVVIFHPKADEAGWVQAAQIATDAVTNAKIGTAAVDTDELATDSVTTVKITDANITAAKLDAETKLYAVPVTLSFETGEQTDYEIIIPHAFTLTNINYTVIKAIAATDDATISPRVNGVATTPSSITISASSALSTSASTAITGGNTGTAGQIINLITAKTTAGGKVLATLYIQRT